MNKGRIKAILILLLAVSSIYTIVLAINDESEDVIVETTSSDKNSETIIWEEESRVNSSDLTDEEKEQFYNKARENALENVILKSFEEVNGVNIEIVKKGGDTKVMVTFDMKVNEEFDYKEAEGIKIFIANSFENMSIENIVMANTQGEKIK